MQHFRSFARALGADNFSRLPRLENLRPAFGKAFAVEADYGRPQLWLGFLLLIGAAVYFSLPFTLPPTALYPGFALSALFAFSLRRLFAAFIVAMAVCAVLLGCIAADIQVRRVATPLIIGDVKPALLQGQVMDVDRTMSGRSRALIEVENIEGFEKAAQPHKVRLTGVNLANLQIGEHIKIHARLRSLPMPTHPGGYSPAFKSFFDGLGGIGTVSEKPELLPPAARTLAEQLSLGLAQWRASVTKRIHDGLGGETGAVAASLITGDRDGLGEDLYQSFNGSGLMHVLSISGLHMVLVAGGMFFLVRLLLAAYGAFFIELPAKKIAALAAIGIVTVYELISGGEVATTRSYIMILIVFGAVLLDRPALSMRNIVVAAVIILLLMPHEIMGASFQMSFAATAALIAAHERKWFPRIKAWDNTWLAKALSWVVTIFLVTVATSLVAEIATLPYTLHHFHRLSVFGIVGNLLALGFIEFAIMPGVLLTLLALPFGLEQWTLPLLGFGVDGMVAVAKLVAGFPAALTGISGFGTLSLLLCSFAITWGCLWRTRIAGLAIVPYAAGLLIGFYEKAPDLYISQTGWSVAARNETGRLSLLASPREKFPATRWMENDGDRRDIDDPSVKNGQNCDPLGCTILNPQVGVVAVSYDRAGLSEDCARADILIVPRSETPPNCARPKRVIDKTQIRAAQGISVIFSKDWHGRPQFDVRSVAGECGTRPWCAPIKEN